MSLNLSSLFSKSIDVGEETIADNKMADDATATPAYRADFACRLAAYRACVRSADLMRYDAEFPSRVADVMRADQPLTTTEPLHALASPTDGRE